MSNDLLIKSYVAAKNLKLDPEFIKQLEDEIKRRSITVKIQESL
ncbi:sporulation histidine kinase inhibitor Sda [Lederbergia sp. NSJ-179]